MELKEIARNVYACLQEDKGLGTSNAGLINSGDGMAVDTFWDLPHTREMMRLYATVWKKPAGRVVNTHHNGDHCWGNQLFEGAEIIAHRECARRFDSESLVTQVKNLPPEAPAWLKGIAAALKDWDFTGVRLTPPTRIIDEDTVIAEGEVKVHLLYTGPAHTAGDLMVHLPSEGVLFAGDIIFRLCTPMGWEGTYANWFKALDRIVSLNPRVIVPGHGPLCGVEGARDMKAYFEHVYAAARRSFDQGLSTLEAAKRIDLGPYARWTEPERIVFSLHRAYREFRSEPFDVPIDRPTIFGEMAALRAFRGRGR
jgi:cyclase